MTGGMSAPPELAAAWTPAAVTGLKPALRIIGMVNVPVVAVLATALPDSDPIKPLLSTATLAGPPGLRPNTRWAKSTMNRVAPVGFEKGAEDHEEEDVGEHDAQRHAKDALGVQKRLRDDARDGVPAVGKQPVRERRSEVRVEKEREREQREGETQRASGRLDDQEEPHDADGRVERGLEAGPVPERLPVDPPCLEQRIGLHENEATAERGQHREQHVGHARHGPVLPRWMGRQVEKTQDEAEHREKGQPALRRHQRIVHLDQREHTQQHAKRVADQLAAIGRVRVGCRRHGVGEVQIPISR